MSFIFCICISDPLTASPQKVIMIFKVTNPSLDVRVYIPNPPHGMDAVVCPEESCSEVASAELVCVPSHVSVPGSGARPCMLAIRLQTSRVELLP